MPGKRSAAVLACSAAIALAAAGATVEGLVQTVRSAVEARRSDKELAEILRRQSMTERLDDAVVEALESEGAGPAAVEELLRLRELSAAMPAGTAPRLFNTPPQPSAEETQQAIEQARAAALRYHDGLPDFLCTETVRRYRDPKGKEAWRPVDVLTIAVTYSTKGENYRLVAINGKPSKRTLEEVGGSLSEGEFGSLLHRVYLPSSDAGFRWERWAMLRRRMVHVFTWQIDSRRAHYAMDYEFEGKPYHLSTAMRGRVYIDRETSQTVRVTWEADGLPPDGPIVRTPAVLDYDYANVGSRRVLLPVRAESRISTVSGQTRNVIEFGEYRKFTSETTITYEKQ